jgi:hypothetical protein
VIKLKSERHRKGREMVDPRRTVTLMAAILLAVGVAGGCTARPGAATLALPRTSQGPRHMSYPQGVTHAVAYHARPNIVVVMTDDMRVDDLAYMPNLRSLVVSKGLRFAQSAAVARAAKGPVPVPPACGGWT